MKAEFNNISMCISSNVIRIREHPKNKKNKKKSNVSD